MPKAKPTVHRSGPYERPAASSSGEASGRIKEEDVAEQVPLASHDQIPEGPAGTDVAAAGIGFTLVSDCAPLLKKLRELHARITGRGYKVQQCFKAMDFKDAEYVVDFVGIEKLADGMKNLERKLLICRTGPQSPRKAIKMDQHEYSTRLENTVLKAEEWLNKIEHLVLTRPTYSADPRRADFFYYLKPLKDQGKPLNVECERLATQCLLLGILL